MIRIFNQLVSLKVAALIQIEALVILSCFFTAAKLWFWNDPAGEAAHASWPFFLVQCLIQMVLLQVCFYYNGLYTVQDHESRTQQLVALMRAIGMLSLISAALYFLAPILAIGRGVTILALILTLAAVFTARLVLDSVWRAAVPTRNLLVVGTGSLAMALVQEVQRRHDLKLRISAFTTVDPATCGGEREYLDCPVRCICNLVEDVRTLDISQIVVALENGVDLPMKDLVELRLRGVSVIAVHEILEALTGRVRLDATPPSEVIFKGHLRLTEFTLARKRALDLFLGLVGTLVAAPVMALTALAIWLESGSPILYRQTRTGLGGKEFELLKFRSMRVDAEPNGEAQWAQLNDPRVTRVGAFLRAYRLDELPQFINVVRGEMSIVGPRPERPFFVGRLRRRIPCYDERHLVRPGVTGWAQVRYPYGRTIDDAVRKLEYDLFYLKNVSFAFDCAIALKTLRIVLLGRGGQ